MSEERLHPEGAPGAFDGFLRTVLGDSGFENLRDAEAEARETTLRSIAADAALTAAKASLLSALVVVMLVGAAMGVGWCVWAWVR